MVEATVAVVDADVVEVLQVGIIDLSAATADTEAEAEAGVEEGAAEATVALSMVVGDTLAEGAEDGGKPHHAAPEKS